MSNDSTKTGRHRDQAYSHFRASRFALAEPLCHEVLANQPANPTALLMLGMICIELNRPGDARKWLHKAYDNAPAIPRYPGRLANGLMHAGLLEQAAGR